MIRNMSNEQDLKEQVEYLTDPIARDVIIYYSKLVLDLKWDSDKSDAFITKFDLKKFDVNLLETANN